MHQTDLNLPSRKREGQRDLGACSLVAAGWATHPRMLAALAPTPSPSRLREGKE